MGHIVKNYILLTAKSWHDDLFEQLKSRVNESWTRISSSKELSLDNLILLNPSKIFIPHWSHILPKEIWDSFECIVFHMTDLPYGRGGSPLQNLILEGKIETKISALKADAGIDTGPVYMKCDLSLKGSAQEIFSRSVPIIHQMIVRILDNNLLPVLQVGQIKEFKRRKPQEGNLNKASELTVVYNYIRMLDAEDYPKAFLETDFLRLEFCNARFDGDKELFTDVRIIKK